VTWNMGHTDDGGFIDFNTNPAPKNVKAYWASTLANNTRRDFRLAAIGNGDSVVIQPVIWRQNRNITEVSEGVFHVEIETVPDVWTGLFIEGEWEGPTGYRMIFTSQVNIVPNTFPRPKCTDNASCYGWLV